MLQQQVKHELHRCCFCGGAANGTTRLATSAVPPLLRGLWPLSSHGQGPKGFGVSPAVTCARLRRSSGLAFLYQQVSYFLLETQLQSAINMRQLSKERCICWMCLSSNIPAYSFPCPHSLTVLMCMTNRVTELQLKTTPAGSY